MAKTRSSATRDQDLSLARTIFDGLCAEITSGQLSPGKPLSRREIAKRYGCSYTPVIEAMVRLEHAGLIETRSSEVARVRSMNVEAIEELSVLREACETQAIRLACVSATTAEIDELYRLAEVLDTRILRFLENDAEVPQLHWRFHRRLATLGRHPILIRELERIDLVKLTRAMWVKVPEILDGPRDHSILIDALAQRDPDAADAVMRAHVRRGLRQELFAHRILRCSEEANLIHSIHSHS